MRILQGLRLWALLGDACSIPQNPQLIVSLSKAEITSYAHLISKSWHLCCVITQKRCCRVYVLSLLPILFDGVKR